VQIVENRRGRLSRPFLSPGDKFSKRYDENQIRSVSVIRLNDAKTRPTAPEADGDCGARAWSAPYLWAWVCLEL
jgi:hypothetical protein